MVFSRKTFLSCFLVLAIIFISMPGLVQAQGGIAPGRGYPTPFTPNPDGTYAPPIDYSCGVTNIKGCVAKLANIILGFFAFLLGLSAFLLDHTLTYTISDLKVHLEKIDSINNTWSAIRDLINLTFIFILLYASIRTILGLESPGKIVKNIVLAAIFINFSMFLTRVLVDVSNSTALFFYDRITDTKGIEQQTSLFDLNTPKGKALTNAYVAPLKINTIYSAAKPAANADLNETAVGYGEIITVGILGSFMLGLVAFVFLAVAFMFIIRYAALIVILIFSPLGFVSSDLPMIGQYKDKWWKTLKSQLLFPPLFMILTWIVVKVINSGTFINASGNFRELASVGGGPPSTNAVGLLMNFVVIMILIVMSLVLSIETASEAGGAISKMYGKATKWAGSTMFGSAGWIGRKTIGSAAMIAADSEKLKGLVKKGGFVGGAAMLGLRAADYTQKGSFDVRGSSIGSTFAETSGIEAGKAGGAGGRKKEVEEKVKELERRAKLTEVSQRRKDEIKEELGDIAAEKKPVDEEIEELKKKEKEAKETDKYKQAEKKNDELTAVLEQIDRDIKNSTAELASGNLTPTGEVATKAKIAELQTKKSEAEAEVRGNSTVMTSVIGEETVRRLKELNKQKAEIETRTGKQEKDLKDEEKNIKAEERARKKAYAKSIRETPDSIESEAGALNESIKKLTSELDKTEQDLTHARETGDQTQMLELEQKRGTLMTNIKLAEETRASLTGGRGFVRKLVSVANIGAVGLEQRAAAGAINKTGIYKFDSNTVGLKPENRIGGAKVGASVSEKSKDAKFVDNLKEYMKDQAKKEEGAASTEKPSEKTETPSTESGENKK